jgi:hypothetical protein
LKVGDHVRILFTNENFCDGYNHYQRGRTGYIKCIDKLNFRCKVSLDFKHEEVWVKNWNIKKLSDKEHYSIIFRQYQKTKQEYNNQSGRLLELIIEMYESVLGIKKGIINKV